jgi:hypothetical protein
MQSISQGEIKYLKNCDINKVLWDECIDKSLRPIVYAYSWYLDCMTENWDGLVLGDYEAVMPLPWKSKFGFKYIYRAPMIQRLGVFSTIQIKDIDVLFFNSIPFHFIKVAYFLFDDLKLLSSSINAIPFQNFVIHLVQPYDKIFANYSDSLKTNINFCKKKQGRIVKVNVEGIEKVLELYRSAYGKFYSDFNTKIYERIKLLMKTSFDRGLGCIYSVVLPDEEIGAMYFVINDGRRVYYLIGAPSELGKKNKCIPFLINEIIKEYAGKNLLFDFEGSQIPSVAKFYQKFSPVIEYYYFIGYLRLLNFRFKVKK